MENNNIYDAEIKVSKWNKVIKINDEGDTITLNISDCTLNARMVNLLNEIQTTMEETSKSEKNFSEDEVLKKLDFINSKQSLIADKVNNFFGEDICYKVFKTNTPYIDDILDFVLQLCNLLEKFTGQKVANLEKIQSKYLDKQKTRRKI